MSYIVLIVFLRSFISLEQDISLLPDCIIDYKNINLHWLSTLTYYIVWSLCGHFVCTNWWVSIYGHHIVSET